MLSMKRIQRGLWGVLVVSIVLGLIVTGVFGQTKKVQKRQIEIEHIQDIDNPDAGFKVELWVDRKDATYNVGDEIQFSFKTNKDSRLTLLNVATTGKVHILFPNEHHKDNLVKAGTTYIIPAKGAKYVFKAQGPAGVDVVKAIATLDKIDLVNKNDCKPAGAFQEVNKPEGQVARDIGVALKPIDPKTYAVDTKVLKIIQ
jgi:hypothetical protein